VHDSRLKVEANLLIMPNLDAANFAFNLLKVTGSEGITVGPMLLGSRSGPTPGPVRLADAVADDRPRRVVLAVELAGERGRRVGREEDEG